MASGVPVIFGTSFDPRDRLADFAGVPALVKPYSPDALLTLARIALSAPGLAIEAADCEARA